MILIITKTIATLLLTSVFFEYDRIIITDPKPHENTQKLCEVDKEALSNTNLNPSLPSSKNFNLSNWYLSVPSDKDRNGFADNVYEGSLNSGYQSRFFYTSGDGAMVFRCPVKGYKTSTNTSYTRVELREMLRKGNTSISTKGVTKNNWVLIRFITKNFAHAPFLFPFYFV